MRDTCTVVAFMGKKRVGKNTCADFLSEHYAFASIAFADPLYDAVDAMFQIDSRSAYWQRQKDTRIVAGTGKTLRQILQTLGTEWGRCMVHPDVWVHLLEVRARAAAASLAGATGLKARFAISDVRMGNETLWCRENGVLVYVENHALPDDDPHISEQSLDPSACRYRVKNTGTKSYLYGQLNEIMRDLALAT